MLYEILMFTKKKKKITKQYIQYAVKYTHLHVAHHITSKNHTSALYYTAIGILIIAQSTAYKVAGHEAKDWPGRWLFLVGDKQSDKKVMDCRNVFHSLISMSHTLIFFFTLLILLRTVPLPGHRWVYCIHTCPCLVV